LRFFTLAWWRGDDESGGDADAPTAYGLHLEAIRHRLPTDLIALEESGDLNDCRLSSFKLSAGAGELSLQLETFEADALLTLTYSGLKQFNGFTDLLGGVGGSVGLGDLGYGECDVLPDGLIEHRLLFSSGIEWVMTFRDLNLRREPLAASMP
jgi:hypothetical protein